jgi:cyclase
MLKKRIIPCLDIKDGTTVKGVNFVDIREAGDPIELAKRYVAQKADELVFLDITATNEKRKTLVELVTRISKEINIPFTVGGGIKSIEDVEAVVKAGADKVSINTAALYNPQLITDIANNFGSQFMVVAIDTNQINGEWYVHTHGGGKATDIRALDWAKELENRGAGEILLTSMIGDGTKQGFSLDITKQISGLVNMPVIASGGAGTKQHFIDVFEKGNADAALAASIFHFNEIPIPELKQYLRENNVPVR